MKFCFEVIMAALHSYMVFRKGVPLEEALDSVIFGKSTANQVIVDTSMTVILNIEALIIRDDSNSQYTLCTTLNL